VQKDQDGCPKNTNLLIHKSHHPSSGLPDYSWFNIPKIPNGRKNFTNGNKVCQHFPLQGPPKCTQSLTLWFANIPSDNPAPQRVKHFSGSPFEVD
jgi:hypothetical protein